MPEETVIRNSTRADLKSSPPPLLSQALLAPCVPSAPQYNLSADHTEYNAAEMNLFFEEQSTG